MSNIVVLSSGHVFAKNSVSCIGPFINHDSCFCGFTIYGVGYVIQLGEDMLYPLGEDRTKDVDRWKKLHKEAIRVLIEESV